MSGAAPADRAFKLPDAGDSRSQQRLICCAELNSLIRLGHHIGTRALPLSWPMVSSIVPAACGSIQDRR